MEYYCKKLDVHRIHNELNNKILPESNHLEIAIKAYIGDDPYYSLKQQEKEKLKKIIELFHLYNYKFSDNDIVKMIKCGLTLEKYIDVAGRIKKNKKLKKELTEVCNEICFYPYGGISMNLVGFKNNLESHIFKHKRIAEAIKKNNIVPDMECLYILCGLTGRKKEIQYLLDNFNLKLDFKCIYTSFRPNKNNSAQLIYMMERYNKENVENKENENKEVKEKIEINHLEKKIEIKKA
jgi:hypothetical protein